MNLEQAWYRKSQWLILLRPLSLLFGWLSRRRRQRLQKQQHPFACPVIIVGNISVGGNGKTPLILELIRLAQQAGLKPGVISRGYGGRADSYPLLLTPDTPVDQSGDEARLIHDKTLVPLVVDPNRVRAAQALLESAEVDLILSDDGLQHYRLHRDFEIAVVDGERGVANQKLLPEGPLREPVSRLNEVDLVVVNGEGFNWPDALRFHLKPEYFRNLKTGEQRAVSPEALGSCRINAVAGIGNPGRFFNQLTALGFQVNGRALPDHARIQASDLAFEAASPLIMTEKDAVKCSEFLPDNSWTLAVRAQFDPAAEQYLTRRLTELVRAHKE